MAIENEGKEPEELDDELDSETSGEGDSSAEPELPQDPNEPIEVVTDEAKKESRRQRRAERQNEFRRTQEEAARLRAENEQLRRQPAYQPPQEQRQQENPTAARIRQIDEAKVRLNREYLAMHAAGKLNSELENKFQLEAEQLQTAKMMAIAQASAPQMNEQEIIRKAAWHQFTTEHADVFHDPNQNVSNWAWAEYHRRRAEGHADTKEMVEDILDQCRIKFGKPPRKLRGSRPDQATKQRLTGLSSRSAGVSADSSGAITMDAHQKRMARIAFMKDGVSEKQAYQKWANTAGKQLNAKK